MAAFRIPDMRIVALAGGGLAVVGCAVALADLVSPTDGATRARVGIPVQTVRIGSGDWTLRTAETAAPSGRFGSGEEPVAAAAPAEVPTIQVAAVTPVAATSAAFAAASFGAQPGSTGSAAGGAVPLLPPVHNRFDDAFQTFGATTGRAVGAVPIAAVPSHEVYPVGPPRAKPTAGGTGPVVVASLGGTPTVDQPRAGTPAAAEPILASEGAPRKMPKGAGPYLDIIRREAKAHGVPLWVALGVIWVESKFDPNLRGSHTVLGLMQVMPSTARYLGYKGPTEDLLKPEVNVKWGMTELAKDLRYADGELCLAVAKYKGGFMTKRINAGAQRYCDQLRKVTGMEGVTHVPVPPTPSKTQTARN